MLPPVFELLKASAAVKAILGDTPRIFRHGEAPQDTTRPYAVWSVLSTVPENNLSDPVAIDRVPLQIDCYHQTDKGIADLAKAVRDAMELACHMTGVPIDQREPDTRLYRMSLQFDYWLPR